MQFAAPQPSSALVASTAIPVICKRKACRIAAERGTRCWHF